MKTKIIFLACLFAGILPCISQQNIGPRLISMGSAGAAIPDVWSVSANPSLLTENKTIIVAINYQKPLVDLTIGNQAAGISYPLKKSTIGIYCSRYGMEEYNEIQASTMISKKFGRTFSLALRGNYHQIKIANYGSISAFSADVGLAFFLSPTFLIGFYINNITHGKYPLKSIANEIQAKFHGGFSYILSDRIIFTSNVNYEDSFIENTFGFEYNITNHFSLRLGLSTRPLNKFMGIGISLQKLKIDLAITRTAFFTYTPQIGLNYAF
jgi:hypothetical protein